MRQIFEDILSVIDFLKTFVYYSLYYSLKIGQCLVQVISLISNNLLLILKELTDIFVIIFESFTIFCQDIFHGFQQFVILLGQIQEGISHGISTGVWRISDLFDILNNGVFDGINHFQKSIINLGAVVVAVFRLCKYVIVLFGSGVWFVVTLVPYSIWNVLILFIYILQSTPGFIFAAIIDITKFTKDCIKEIYLFVTDVPVESVIGLGIAICLIYLLTQFYLTIFSFLYSKMKYVLRSILNKFQRMPLSQQRTVPAVNCRPPISRIPQLRRTYSTTSVDVKNEMADERFCIICQERIKCILVLPCRHVCMCTECHSRLQLYNNTCPICRNDIESTMKIFV